MKRNSLFMAIAAFALGAAIYSYFVISGKHDKETASIASEAVTAISTDWNAEALKMRADPGLIKAMASQGQSAEELLRIYSVLGKLKKTADCKVHTTGTFMKAEHQHNTISFECDADYEKGPAVVSITLSKADNEEKWLIYYINIRSDVFGELIE